MNSRTYLIIVRGIWDGNAATNNYETGSGFRERIRGSDVLAYITSLQ